MTRVFDYNRAERLTSLKHSSLSGQVRKKMTRVFNYSGAERLASLKHSSLSGPFISLEEND
jgi:hypothetical protein